MNQLLTQGKLTLNVVNNGYISVDDVSTFFCDIDPNINFKLKNDININKAGYKSDAHLEKYEIKHIPFLLNARSLTKHLEEISILIQNQSFKFTFLCFTETWINNETIE